MQGFPGEQALTPTWGGLLGFCITPAQLRALVESFLNAPRSSVSLPDRAPDQEPEGLSLGSATHLLYNLGKSLNHRTSASHVPKGIWLDKIQHDESRIIIIEIWEGMKNIF